MTKSQKTKKPTAVSKIARKTLGLMVRVGDVLEAAAVAVAPVPTPGSAPSAATPGSAPSASSAPTAPLVPSAAPLAPPPAEPPAVVNEAGARAQDATPAVSKAVEEGARAIAAIEAYATQHNLQAVDMPSLGTMIDAFMTATAAQGPKFTDAEVRLVIDEQMRIHLRSLGARTVAQPAAGSPSLAPT